MKVEILICKDARSLFEASFKQKALRPSLKVPMK